jgi:hypothetical protein
MKMKIAINPADAMQSRGSKILVFLVGEKLKPRARAKRPIPYHRNKSVDIIERHTMPNVEKKNTTVLTKVTDPIASHEALTIKPTAIPTIVSVAAATTSKRTIGKMFVPFDFFISV